MDVALGDDVDGDRMMMRDAPRPRASECRIGCTFSPVGLSVKVNMTLALSLLSVCYLHFALMHKIIIVPS